MAANAPSTATQPEPASTTCLIARRTIGARPARVFELWTQPAHLLAWWGPRAVECVAAEMDLRAGGGYRIANRFADGREVSIEGTFERVSAPRELVYSWRLVPDATGGAPSRVTVRFEACPGGTEVTVVHERLTDDALREHTRIGWRECLAGLAAYAARRVASG